MITKRLPCDVDKPHGTGKRHAGADGSR
jgi:hypothetical protein